jgi:HAD superfamily hydrolase (TIGR01509 family)
MLTPGSLAAWPSASALVTAAVKGHLSAMDFSAVLFDFDGVLVDTEWAIYQAWLRTFQAHGHDLPLEIYTHCIGSDFATWSPKTHLEEISGLSFDWHDLDAQRQAKIMAELENSQPMAGAAALLEWLAERAIPCAVVSSSSHAWVDGWLEKLALHGYFKTVVCRGDAPKIKPEPDLYLEAAKRLQLLPPQCLVIEDSLNGVKSAIAADMPVWAVPNRVTCGLDFANANRRFSSLLEMVAALG